LQHDAVPLQLQIPGKYPGKKSTEYVLIAKHCTVSKELFSSKIPPTFLQTIFLKKNHSR